MYSNYFILDQLFLTLLFLLFSNSVISDNVTREPRLMVVTTVMTPHLRPSTYLQRISESDLNIKILTGESSNSNLLVKLELEKFRSDLLNNLILLYVPYESIFLANSAQILGTFKEIKTRISFMGHGENNFAYIGYGSSVLKFLSEINIDEPVTQIISNKAIRSKFGIKLDKTNKIFQIVDKSSVEGIGSCANVQGYAHEHEHKPGILDLRFSTPDGVPMLINTVHNTKPLIIFPRENNQENLSILNYFANYLVGNASVGVGLGGQDVRSDLSMTAERDLPTVLLGLFITCPTPFLYRYFDKITKFDYPKNKLHIYLYNVTKDENIDTFVTNNGRNYASVTISNDSDARRKSIETSIRKMTDFYFVIDAEAHLSNPNILRHFIQQNKPVISPFLFVPYKTRSNYWGLVNSYGKVKRSPNYMDVVSGAHRGLWSVPCVSAAYLVNMTAVKSKRIKLEYNSTTSNLCDQSGSFYLSNREKFGHMISTKRFKPGISELFQIQDNRYDWELNYLHPDWKNAIDFLEEPCPDVFWFPLLSERFCQEIIQSMEEFGNWTAGTNYMPLEGESHPNWDPYPTVDIDLKEIGFARHWWEIVEAYVRPVQLHVFGGHVTSPFIDTTLVIRYRPEEQSSNRPHHDTSTYTINMALNEGFEGGGCRFIRQNCSVTKGRVGWALIHPGELTHFHEGLSTTKGTRYILVSFIDPRDKDRDDNDIYLYP